MPLGIDKRRAQGNHRLAPHAVRQCIELFARLLALHRREQAARRDKMPARLDELRELRESAGNHEREWSFRLPALDASFVHLDIRERELDGGLAQEGAFLLI